MFIGYFVFSRTIRVGTLQPPVLTGELFNFFLAFPRDVFAFFYECSRTSHVSGQVGGFAANDSHRILPDLAISVSLSARGGRRKTDPGHENRSTSTGAKNDIIYIDTQV